MSNWSQALGAAGNAIGAGIREASQYNARAAANANAVSKASQDAQGNFNAGQATIANTLGSDRIAEQYGFNSAQAAMANEFTAQMWDKSAAWNESMFNRAMEFNAEQAQLNREWQEKMRATAYQTAVKDMEAAGLNPIMAVNGGQIQTGMGSAGSASIGMPSMSSAQGAMASGGLLNGLAASEGNYSGQMEYMGGIMGLLSAGMSGISAALKVMGSNTNVAEIMGGIVDKIFEYKDGQLADKITSKNPITQSGEKIQDRTKNSR